MNDFTKGEWNKNARPNGKVSIVGDSGRQVCLMWNDSNREANAKLIATAGTTATKLAEQGYDAVKVLQLLPEIMEIVKTVSDACVYGDATDLIEQVLAKTEGESHDN